MQDVSEEYVPFLLEHVIESIEYMPIYEQESYKSSLFSSMPLYQNSYKVGINCLDVREMMIEHGENIFYVLKKEGTLKECTLVFMIVFASVVAGNRKNCSSYDDFFIGYRQALFDILERQKVSLLEFIDEALQFSALLKYAIYAFKLKNHDETKVLEKMYSNHGILVSDTFAVWVSEE